MLKSTSTASRRMLLQAGLASTILAACSDAKPAQTSLSSVIKRDKPQNIAKPHPSFTIAKIPAPSAHNPMPVISEVPAGKTRQVALTLDDGVNSEVLAGYIKLAKEANLRLTFFPNGKYASWTENKKQLAPLIESGQIQLGNHTWNHPNITTISPARVKEELLLNEKFFHNTYGYNLQPYFRPPYGFYNRESYSILRSMGYTHICMWYGTLGDENNISSTKIMNNAKQYCLPGHIVIGHLNHPGILKDYDKLHSLLESRKLTTVTLKDVYGN